MLTVQTQPTLDDEDAIFVQRTEDGVLAVIVSPGGRTERLPHVVRHSPTGFEYGYGGSGPADLALSILTACLGPETADRLYHDFKWHTVAKQHERAWTITVGAVREWAKAHVAASEAEAASFQSIDNPEPIL